MGKVQFCKGVVDKLPILFGKRVKYRAVHISTLTYQVPHGEIPEGIEKLRDPGAKPGPLSYRKLLNWMPINEDMPPEGRSETYQGFEEGCFPRTIGAKDYYNGSFPDLHREGACLPASGISPQDCIERKKGMLHAAVLLRSFTRK